MERYTLVVGCEPDQQHKAYFHRVAACNETSLKMINIPLSSFNLNLLFAPSESEMRELVKLEEALPESHMVIVDGVSFGSPYKPRSSNCLLYQISIERRAIQDYSESRRRKYGKGVHSVSQQASLDDLSLSVMEDCVGYLSRLGDLTELEVPKRIKVFRGKTGSILPIVFYINQFYHINLTQALSRVGGYDGVQSLTFSPKTNEPSTKPEEIVARVRRISAEREPQKEKK